MASSLDDLFDRARAGDPNARVITVRGAREHNLKNVDLMIPRDRFVVFTGLSGSGKSSLAFDTIYAEGQRRYVESLSAYARQFLEMMSKPDVDQIDGLSPAISIEQKTTSRNPRSTVGTVTEIYDYMRLLWARVGIPYSPATGLPIESQTVSQMVDRVLELPEKTRLYLWPRGARPQGRVPQGDRRVPEEGLPAPARWTANTTPSTRSLPSTRSSSTTSTWWWTGSWCARHRGAPGGFLRDALDLADGIAVIEYADEKDENGQPKRIDLLVQVRLPGLRLHDLRDRAALFSFNNPFGACPTCAASATRCASIRTSWCRTTP
jgi:excinuclease ABC subunit A